MVITYTFELETDERYDFDVDLNRKHTPERDQQKTEDWTSLGFQQCSNCPLSENDCQRCPAAADLQDIVETFAGCISHTPANVTVFTPDRTYMRDTDAQTAIDSLIGLVMATSGCPILGRFRTLARTHLPFASQFDVIFRVLANYLLMQYFGKQDGKQPDWNLDELREFYQQLTEVNRCLSERVRAASKEDANINAFIQLSSITMMVSMSLDEQLADCRDELLSGSPA